MRTISLLLVLLLLPAFGAERSLGWIPASPETVSSTTVRIYRVHLANTSASSVTVTIADRTTNCSSGPCEIWPAVSIGADTAYVADLGGLTATSGFTIVASTGSVVTAWISYGNP